MSVILCLLLAVQDTKLPANVWAHWVKVDAGRNTGTAKVAKDVANYRAELAKALRTKREASIKFARARLQSAERRLETAKTGLPLPEFDSDNLPKPDDAGTCRGFTIVQIIDESNMVVRLHPIGTRGLVWISDVKTKGLVDDTPMRTDTAFVCTGTTKWGGKTILHVRLVDSLDVESWRQFYKKLRH